MELFKEYPNHNSALLVIDRSKEPIDTFFAAQKCISVQYDKLPQTIVYKFFPMDKLCALLQENKLFMDRIISWEDCYENFFFKEDFQVRINGAYQSLSANNLATGIFGQSWTIIPESDALWRIYSKNKDAVRVKVNAQKLFHTIYTDNYCMADTWAGIVTYKKQSKIDKWVKDVCYNQDSVTVWQEYAPKSLFYKRTEFQHENEFRIVKMLDSQNNKKYQHYQRLAFNIDVNDFILSLTLDPRLNALEIKQQTDRLIELGIEKEKIEQSTLYTFTPLHIHLRS